MSEQATAVEPAEPATSASPAAAPGGDRAGWLGVAAITAVVAVSWAPLLTARFGDNHLGRVQGRYALQLRNLFQEGLSGSTFAADWSPYSDNPYAHHPPLPNLLFSLFGLVPGEHEWEVRAGPYLFALLAIPAAALLLRSLGIGWVPTLLAAGAMAATGYYWVYAPLMFDLGVILVFAAVVAVLRRQPSVPRWLVATGCVAALLTGLASWPGVAFAAGLVLWLAAKRRLDRVTIVVGVGALAGIALSLAYMFGVHGFAALADQTELRAAGGGFTAGEFVQKQAEWFQDLLPAWYLLVLPAAVAAGLIDRRTRFFTALATLFAAGWVVVLNNGAYVHDYWAFLVVVPGVAGFGALFDWLARQVPARIAAAGAVVVAVGLAATFATMVLGPAGRDYLYRPIAAGELAVAHPPDPGQEFAWHVGLRVPRWLAYYWDRHPEELTEAELVGQARPTDLVLVDLRRRPGWFPDGVAPIAHDGRYAVYRVADMREGSG